ncbi:MAG: hypothetical protein F9B45_00135 [Phycisphaera sp. RhM]|nr:hypothetical protein [Phycisphaera sp. RhM]
MSHPNPYRPTQVVNPDDLRDLQSPYRKRPAKPVSARTRVVASLGLFAGGLMVQAATGSFGFLLWWCCYLASMICLIWAMFATVAD